MKSFAFVGRERELLVLVAAVLDPASFTAEARSVIEKCKAIAEAADTDTVAVEFRP